METAPRNAEWIMVANEAGEHKVHFTQSLSGDSKPACRGWFLEKPVTDGRPQGYRELARRPLRWRELRVDER